MSPFFDCYRFYFHVLNSVEKRLGPLIRHNLVLEKVIALRLPLALDSLHCNWVQRVLASLLLHDISEALGGPLFVSIDLKGLELLGQCWVGFLSSSWPDSICLSPLFLVQVPPLKCGVPQGVCSI